MGERRWRLEYRIYCCKGKKGGLPWQHGQPKSHEGPKRNEVKQNNGKLWKKNKNKGRAETTEVQELKNDTDVFTGMMQHGRQQVSANGAAR